MAAREKLFGTTEILENVLLCVDQRTLLTSAQRVCRTWQQLIAESPKLQQHLFLRPAPESVTTVVNPLLAEKFPHWFSQKVGDGNEQFTPFEPGDLESYDLARESRNTAFIHEGATWRKMLPRQPPVYSFVRCLLNSTMSGQFTTLARVTETGVTNETDDQAEFTADNELVDPKAEPLRMERFYHLITGGYGDSHTWLFVWDNHGDKREKPSNEELGKAFSRLKAWLQTPMRQRRINDDRDVHTGPPENGLLPVKVGLSTVGSDARSILEDALKRDGLVMFECSTMQCSGDGPWRFAKKFRMKDRW